MWRPPALLLIAVAACSSAPRKAPAPPPPPPPVAVTPTPAPDPVPDPTPAPKPPMAPEDPFVLPPRPPPVLVVAAECRGDHLDLKALLSNPTQVSACLVKWPVQPVPSTIALALDPTPLTVKPGGTVSAALVLTNTSDAEVTLALDEGCGQVGAVQTSVHDAKGKRVDVTNAECEVDGACGQGVVAFTLSAGGTARVPFDVHGYSEAVADSCGHKRGANLPRGAYEVTVASTFGTFKSAVTVK